MLYEDEFDNYNYEKGFYSEIEFSWNEVSKKLTISNRKGQYIGMLISRKCNIVMPNGMPKIINFNGKKVEERF
ncbi:MAG: DUF5110 domain-containing protein [Flavobacterium sp.]